MARRLLLILFVVLAAFGVDRLATARSEVAGEVACCACDDEACAVHDCCGPTGCACAPHLVAAPAPRIGAPSRPSLAALDPAWTTSTGQRARERRTAPPTPPPIG